MNLKNKISLIASLLFTVIFAVSASIIYVLFADFRKDEFESRLQEKAISSIKLLVEVKEVDRHLLKIIDENSIHKLYDEKTLIFDDNYNLIYSSIDDSKIKWKIDDLKYLKANKSFFRKDNNKEIYGEYYKISEKGYFGIISAADVQGQRKLEYLLFILIATYIAFTIISWITTSYLVKKLLLPLDSFHSKLKGINENNLGTRILVKENKDEIDLLANEFNLMLHRIDISYQKQKEFTANASHELRTPIARITSQLENKIIAEKNSGLSSVFYENILKDINQVSELISSLLLLSKSDNLNNSRNEIIRIDELIFEASRNINKTFPDFKLLLEIKENETTTDFIEIKGNKSLLLIAFTNLLKNAYTYSNNQQVMVMIYLKNSNSCVSIANTGNTISEEDQKLLFQPFMRGKNAKNKSGLGLGLRIVQRIILQHNAFIDYHIESENINVFTINFQS